MPKRLNQMDLMERADAKYETLLKTLDQRRKVARFYKRIDYAILLIAVAWVIYRFL